MFSLFGSPPFVDALLGDLRRKGGVWRGTIDLGGARAPLALPGPRSAPDPHAIDLARTVPSAYLAWRGRIATALFEHYQALAESVAGGDLEGASDDLPRIGRPDEVWPHVRIAFVAIPILDGERCVEIGYQVAWDDDHTLGARLRSGRLIELSGSVLPP